MATIQDPGNPLAPSWVEEFIELVCSDPELVAAEFAAIIAAEWPTVPPASPLCAARSAHARPQDTSDGARTSVAGRATGCGAPEPGMSNDPNLSMDFDLAREVRPPHVTSPSAIHRF